MTVPVQVASDLSRTQPVISAAGAKAVLRAAEAKAAEIGVPVVIVVVDESGDLKALLGMDGPPKGAIQWSIDKAVTAASFRTPTHVLAQATEGAPASAVASLMAQPHATLAPGGFPLVIDGVVVGAVGASGGTPDQDHTVAQAGVAALGDGSR
jgi:glc operon protein GlcG